MRLSLFILLAIITISCSEVSENDEKRIFSEIFDTKIISEYPEKLGDSYLVYPYYVDFDFNAFLSKKLANHPSRKKITQDVFSKLNIDENIFSKIKEEINQKYKGLYSKSLYDLSTGDESNLVFTFSGLSDDLVFVNIYIYHDAIPKESLDENFDFHNNLASLDSFITFLDSDKRIVKNVVHDDGVTIEWWPNGKTK
ncbi:hypothetical protein F0000_25195 [Aquimarina sp. RZ0]|nr:hypothetical protein F0000_25195 [Aquimarina sp. RZ0]